MQVLIIYGRIRRSSARAGSFEWDASDLELVARLLTVAESSFFGATFIYIQGIILYVWAVFHAVLVLRSTSHVTLNAAPAITQNQHLENVARASGGEQVRPLLQARDPYRSRRPTNVDDSLTGYLRGWWKIAGGLPFARCPALFWFGQGQKEQRLIVTQKYESIGIDAWQCRW